MNREAELEPPSRVACSELLDHKIVISQLVWENFFELGLVISYFFRIRKYSKPARDERITTSMSKKPPESEPDNDANNIFIRGVQIAV